MRLRWDTLALAGLSAVAIALAGYMLQQGLSRWDEALAVGTGALCVWLTVKESVWNFPVSLVNVTISCWVYSDKRLYGDAGLQVVFFILTAIGWYQWLYGGERKTELRISRTNVLENVLVVAAVGAGTVLLWQTLWHWGGSASLWDGLVTSLSLGAQWLLNRKKLETWIFWILVDVVSVPLYFSKELYLVSLLYCVFLVMATMGLLAWWTTWRKQQAVNVRGFEVVEAEA